MNKLKTFLCNEEPALLAMYTIVALLVIIEFCMMGWQFILVCIGAVVCGVVVFGIGYVLMRVIKKLQENCDVQETESEVR